MTPQSGAGVGADYGYAAPLAPGAVDPVRLAALVEGIECGGPVWDPAEEALFGPDPDVDPAALFAALDAEADNTAAASGIPADGSAGMVEPAVLVPARMPGLEDLAPGVDLAGMLDGADLPGLGAYEVVETIAGWQRIASWAAARQAAAITELTRRAEMRPVADGRAVESMNPLRVTGMEVAARLTLTPHQGDGLTARARVWCEDLPATLAALEAGRIDVRRAEVIADTLRGHSLQLARRVEAEVLGRAEELTAARLRRAIIQVLHRLAPDTMTERARHAADDRYVRVSPARDGMAWLEAYLPAADAAAVQTAVEAAAAAAKHADPDDRRTLAQRRADALAEMGWLALATGRLGGCGCGQRLTNRHGRPVSVQVTVPLTMLLGLDEHPGELAGYGPIPAQTARKLAAAGTWRRLVTDPITGALLDYGRTRYQPPPDLAEHVITRDRTCRWPGCDRPAAGCHLDHTIAYPHGPTAAGNLGPFCESQHLGKHHSRWTVSQPEPGRFQFISPTGHVYTVEPEPLAPTLDADEPEPGTSDHPPPQPAGPPDEPPF